MITNRKKLRVRNLIPYYLLFLLCNYIPAQNKANSILSEANIEIPRISPIPTDVEGINNTILYLIGTWKVAFDHGEEKSIQVPEELTMQGFDLNAGETAHYQKSRLIH